jgi:catechol 2,3-dioxygenase-like lactoylglutathione lyase family enzyme
MPGTDARRRPAVRATRRSVLAGLSAAALLAPRALAQSPTPPTLRLRKLNGFEIRVADVERTVAFYQGMFGMRVLARSADRVVLGIGAGPQHMKVREVGAGEPPAITHIGYSVEDYEPARVLAALEALGYARIDAPPLSASGLAHAMKAWVRDVGETPEIYFADPRGLIVQLTHPDACGGAGPNGDRCAPAAAPAGPLSLDDLNHFTVFLNDGAGANRYYRETFGLAVQAHQGPAAEVTGIGDGRQFVMYAGPPRDEPAPAVIHHGCFSMHGFDVEGVLRTLTEFGLSAQDDRPIGPLMHYVTLRMPERGGAEGGTPELYFTDPDGLLMQLQDVAYCGGGGDLGEICAG